MAEHIQVKHENCDVRGCPICDGGLFVCEVCGGLEGGVPTECPGERMSPQFQHELVYGGLLDFRGGKWVIGSNLELSGWREPTTTESKIDALAEALPRLKDVRDIAIADLVLVDCVVQALAVKQ